MSQYTEEQIQADIARMSEAVNQDRYEEMVTKLVRSVMPHYRSYLLRAYESMYGKGVES